MQQRLIDLETRLAFQQDHIDALTRTVAEQQRQIDDLRRDMDTLSRQVRTMTPLPLVDEQDQSPPPHY